MKRMTCGQCGMAGHYSSTCHVVARGAREPDEADRLASELYEPLYNRIRRGGGPADVRLAMSSLIRDPLVRFDVIAGEEPERKRGVG